MSSLILCLRFQMSEFDDKFNSQVEKLRSLSNDDAYEKEISLIKMDHESQKKILINRFNEEKELLAQKFNLIGEEDAKRDDVLEKAACLVYKVRTMFDKQEFFVILRPGNK